MIFVQTLLLWIGVRLNAPVWYWIVMFLWCICNIIQACWNAWGKKN